MIERKAVSLRKYSDDDVINPIFPIFFSKQYRKNIEIGSYLSGWAGGLLVPAKTAAVSEKKDRKLTNISNYWQTAHDRGKRSWDNTYLGSKRHSRRIDTCSRDERIPFNNFNLLNCQTKIRTIVLNDNYTKCLIRGIYASYEAFKVWWEISTLVR